MQHAWQTGETYTTFLSENTKDEQLQKHRNGWHGIKTNLKEIVRSEHCTRSRIIINGKIVEQEQSFKYLGFDIATIKVHKCQDMHDTMSRGVKITIEHIKSLHFTTCGHVWFWKSSVEYHWQKNTETVKMKFLSMRCG